MQERGDQVKYKHTMPEDVRALCVAHVQGYERRCRELRAKHSGKAEQSLLEQQGGSQDKQSVVAVEIALIQAMQGIKNHEVRTHLRKALLLNICNRKQFPYERLYVPTVGKKEFYRRKQDLLMGLADILGYLED